MFAASLKLFEVKVNRRPPAHEAGGVFQNIGDHSYVTLHAPFIDEVICSA